MLLEGGSGSGSPLVGEAICSVIPRMVRMPLNFKHDDVPVACSELESAFEFRNERTVGVRNAHA